MMNIVLASASPRRKEILAKLGIPFEVRVSSCDENIGVKEPCKLVEQLSMLKANDVARSCPEKIVIGADTVVSLKGLVMGKPVDRDDAINMLRTLSGNVHQVYTGVTIVIPGIGTRSFVEKTDVEIVPMTDEEIVRYVDSGEPMDKAGAYAIQGLFAPFVRKIDGDYYNVVGLPISAVYKILYSLTNIFST